MNLSDLKPCAGAKKKAFRVGRGHGSGNGKFAGRGRDGQNSRTGGGVRPGFEGGQMPLYRRIPKRGFTNRNSKDIIGINVQLLNRFNDGDDVNIESMIAAGIIKNPRDGVKILAKGELTKKLNISANAFSEGAKQKIEALGGKTEVM